MGNGICVSSSTFKLPRPTAPANALPIQSAAFFTDHCSLPEPERSTRPFWHLKPWRFAFFSQSRIPPTQGRSDSCHKLGRRERLADEMV